VKVAKPVAEKKTPGTLIVEKYRPRMNKLTPAERQQLRNRAMQLAFGHGRPRSDRPCDCHATGNRPQVFQVKRNWALERDHCVVSCSF
jgi:hypothetical protein